MRGLSLTCLLAATGCSSILGLHDPPDQADAAGDDAVPPEPDADLGPAGCGVNTAINDPGFVDPAAWTVTGAASIDATAAGDMDPGIGQVLGMGGLSQSVCVAAPPSDRGLALIASVESDGHGPQSDIITAVGAELRDKRGWTQTFSTWTQCLGELTYDRQLTVMLSGDLRMGDYVHYDKLRIAQVSTVTCPAVNTARSGDFENAAAWNNSTFVEGATGARYLHLHTNPYCNAASVNGDGIVSPPKVLPHAALEFKVSGYLPPGSSTFSLYLKTGTTSATPLSVTAIPGSAQIYTACIPATMLGHVLDVTFSIFSSQTSPCPGMDAYIDDLTVTSSTLCP